MRIAVGGIAHDRWTVPEWLSALRALETGEHEIEWCFVLDGYSPPAELGEHEHIAQVLGLASLQSYRRQGGTPESCRSQYSRLALLRNMLADMALGLGCDALLSVDSDIVVPPDLLVQLVETGMPWAAGLVRNSATNPAAWNVWAAIEEDPLRVRRFVPPIYAGGAILLQQGESLAAGAVCLYSADLLRAARWSSNAEGLQEDVCFAAEAFRAGYRAAYIPVVCKHLTIEG